jgi:hypothetical protein
LRVSEKEGYDGIEIWWPLEKKGTGHIVFNFKNMNWRSVSYAGSDSHYQKHFDQFVQMIDGAATNPFSARCISTSFGKRLFYL